jgi:hypothetical protein
VRQDTSFCQAILDGRLPAVIPDVTESPLAMSLPSARIPRIRSYVSTPVHLSDGSLYGTFCAFGFRSDKELGKRDEALMEVLASAAGRHRRARGPRPGAAHRDRGPARPGRRRRRPRRPAAADRRPRHRRRVGAEALSRFPAEWGRTPDVVFAEAHSVGMGHALSCRPSSAPPSTSTGSAATWR